MWPCEYCQNMIEIPYLICPDCNEKEQVQHDILIKRQERILYYAKRKFKYRLRTS